MNLAGILPLIEDALDGGRLREPLPADAAPSIVGVSDGAKACFLAVLSRRLAVPLLIVDGAAPSRPRPQRGAGRLAGRRRPRAPLPAARHPPLRAPGPRLGRRPRPPAPPLAADRRRVPPSPLVVVASVQALSQTVLSPARCARPARQSPPAASWRPSPSCGGWPSAATASSPSSTCPARRAVAAASSTSSRPTPRSPCASS